MAHTVDNTIEGRLRAVEAALRSLRATNLTDLASVVNAAGEHVPLSSLAFGQVDAAAAEPALFTVNTETWFYGDPVLDVRVTGGRLRVDLAAHLVAYGVNLRMAMGYRLLGPGVTAGGDLVTVAQAPDESRALFVISSGGAIATQAAAGMPDLATDLTPGWYRVQAAYQLLGEEQPPDETSGAAINRRIFATPL